MKITGRIICMLLSLTLIFTVTACVRKPNAEEKETDKEEISTTRAFEYMGEAVENIIDKEYREESTQEDLSFEETTYKQNPIKNIIDMLPNANKQDNDENKTVKVNIEPGLTMVKIFAILDYSGVASFSSLMNASYNVDFSFYPLIDAQKNSGRAHVLEGYLCSGEYEFKLNSKPEDVIGAMLRRTESKITTQYRRQIANQGKTIDDIIIIASIIEKECANEDEMSKVSAVINNRLMDGMKLEMKSSGMYIDSDITPYIASGSEEKVKNYNDYYNTYVCPGLPVGPICTPSKAAIDAALNPQGDYRYFCVDAQGKYYYSETYQDYEKDMLLAGFIESY